MLKYHSSEELSHILLEIIYKSQDKMKRHIRHNQIFAINILYRESR